jgi:hypothetical protein
VTDPPTDEQLRAFILGQLSHSEADEVRSSLLRNPVLLEAAEDDLIADYVQGRLTSEESSRIHRIYANSTEGERRIDFARALATHVDRTARTRRRKLFAMTAALIVSTVSLSVLALRDDQIAVRLRPGMLRAPSSGVVLNVRSNTQKINVTLESEPGRTGSRIRLIHRPTGSSLELLPASVTSSTVTFSLSGKQLLTGPYAIHLFDRNQTAHTYFVQVEKQ